MARPELSAYVLAADPTWLRASVLSYYSLVNRIVVSYAEDGRGWTGEPIAVEESLRQLRAIDSEKKMVFLPGIYARTGHSPLENDTFQRQEALKEAAKYAPWVVQLDTDEALLSGETFLECIGEAQRQGMHGVDYPSRWIYRQLGNRRYLEMCSRFWRTIASYPGPMAVRNDVIFKCARQIDVPRYRADFRPTNTDPWGSADMVVHRVISPVQAILHYSWVRSEDALQKKFNSWGHARDKDWGIEYRRWMWAGRHPYLKMATCPFVRGNRHKHFRVVDLRKETAVLVNPENL